MFAKAIKWAVNAGITYIISTVGEFTAEAFYDAYKNYKELVELEEEQLRVAQSKQSKAKQHE